MRHLLLRSWVHFRGCGFNGFNDVLVARAAAEIALESVPDIVPRGVGIAPEQLIGCDNHAGRAEAALQAVFLPKALLQRVQIAIGPQAFNGGDFCTVSLDGKQGAGFCGLPVQQHGAGAAQGSFATNVGSRKPCNFTKVMHQQHARLNVVLTPRAVYVDSDSHLAAPFEEKSAREFHLALLDTIDIYRRAMKVKRLDVGSSGWSLFCVKAIPAVLLDHSAGEDTLATNSN
jgi:hypothetical protein